MDDDNLGKFSKYYREIVPYVGLGLQLAITVGVFVFIGWWLDSKMESDPLWILVFSFLGIGVGLYVFIKTVLDADKKRNQ